MRTANFGILLLTAMVVTKYVISLYTFGVKDGSFKSGIAFDYDNIRYEIAELRSRHVNDRLLAFNSFDEIKTNHAIYESKEAPTKQSGSDFDANPALVEASQNDLRSAPGDEEPLPMDYRNSLVVYDMTNPSNSLIASTYDDVEDDIPLDNGNTIISGMMLVMPRR